MVEVTKEPQTLSKSPKETENPALKMAGILTLC
jgi:hypothetical protein